jgi:hypothetical protein
MQRNINTSHGIKWGLIIGFIYCLLLLLRYNFGANNPIMFSLWIFLGYIITLVLLLISGFLLRKQNNGFIDLKEAFRVLFISVLIFEFFYAVFNFVYLKYVNPIFYQSFRDATEAYLIKSNQPQEQIDKVTKAIDVDAPKKMNLFDMLKSYLFFVAISGAIAFLFALIIRKKNPFGSEQDQFLQAQ